MASGVHPHRREAARLPLVEAEEPDLPRRDLLRRLAREDAVLAAATAGLIEEESILWHSNPPYAILVTLTLLMLA